MRHAQTRRHGNAVMRFRAVVVGEKSERRGSGFGTVTSLIRVTIDGVGAPILSADDDRLTLQVPYGTRSGELRLSRGGNSTEPMEVSLDAPDYPGRHHGVPRRRGGRHSVRLESLQEAVGAGCQRPPAGVELRWQRSGDAAWGLRPATGKRAEKDSRPRSTAETAASAGRRLDGGHTRGVAPHRELDWSSAYLSVPGRNRQTSNPCHSQNSTVSWSVFRRR